jgi:hypothetical protein
MKAPRPFPFLAVFLLLILPLVLLGACTDSDPQDGAEVSASIGNDCGPADAREVWLRVAEPGPGDTNAVDNCPAFTDGGMRIRILEGEPLDSLRETTYTDLPARDCRASTTSCPALKATVRITEFGDWEVRGTYELFDTSGAVVQDRVNFRAARCVLTPHCG